jgi:hypothetical protein
VSPWIVGIRLSCGNLGRADQRFVNSDRRLDLVCEILTTGTTKAMPLNKVENNMAVKIKKQLIGCSE